MSRIFIDTNILIDFLTRRGKFFNPAWGVISSLTAKGVKAKVDNTFDGIYGNVTLSWSNATDRFYTSSIGWGSVTIAQGKAFTDGTNIYSGTIENQTSALAGKTLAPCLALADTDDNTTTIADHAGHTIAVTLQDRTLYKYGAWNTLCLPFALGNANAATGHHFDGTPLEGATVKELDTTGSYSPVALTPNDKSNLFLGTSTEDDQTVSTLYYPDDSNNQDGNYYIYACRGYFHVDLNASSDSSEGGGSVRAFVLNFGDGEVSGITTTNYTNYTNFTDSDAWYSLDGRRLSSKPAKKGLYIHNGRKVAIK